MTPTISDVIAALEQASGPMFTLDRDIALAIGIATINEMLPPAYTGNLDRAIGLVPEGWQWQASNRAPSPHKGRAYINNRELIFEFWQRRNPAHMSFEATAATPAIAMCIVCLRAIEAGDK